MSWTRETQGIWKLGFESVLSLLSLSFFGHPFWGPFFSAVKWDHQLPPSKNSLVKQTNKTPTFSWMYCYLVKKLHFPASFPASYGHLVKFWPIRCKKRCHVWLVGRILLYFLLFRMWLQRLELQQPYWTTEWLWEWKQHMVKQEDKWSCNY